MTSFPNLGSGKLQTQARTPGVATIYQPVSELYDATVAVAERKTEGTRSIGMLLHDSVLMQRIPGSGAWECVGMYIYCNGIFGPENLGREGEENMTGIVGSKVGNTRSFGA